MDIQSNCYVRGRGKNERKDHQNEFVPKVYKYALNKYPHMFIFCAYLLHFCQTNETAAAIGLPEKKWELLFGPTDLQ